MTVFEMRSRLQLTQSDFAAKFGVTTRAVQSWEQGWRQPPASIVLMMHRIIELEEENKRLRTSLEWRD